MNTFPNQLKKYRKQKGLSQKALASQLGIGQTTIANYERGSRMPHPDLLVRMADLLGVDLDHLVSGGGLEAPLNMDAMFKDLTQAVKARDSQALYTWAHSMNQAQVAMTYIYENMLIPLLHMIGDWWQQGQIDVYEEHAMSYAIEVLMGYLVQDKPGKPMMATTFAAMTIEHENHLMAMKMLMHLAALEGYKTQYLGANLPLKHALAALRATSIQVLSISCTMADHVDHVKTLIQVIRQDKTLKHLTIIVGGQAFEQDPMLWHRVGANLHGQTLSQTLIALKHIKKVVQ